MPLESGQLTDSLLEWINSIKGQRGYLTDAELTAQADTTSRPIGEKFDIAEETMEGRMAARGIYDAPFTLEDFQRLDKEELRAYQDLMTNLTTGNLEIGAGMQSQAMGQLGSMWSTKYSADVQRELQAERIKAAKKKWWESITSMFGSAIGTAAGTYFGGGGSLGGLLGLGGGGGGGEPI